MAKRIRIKNGKYALVDNEEYDKLRKIKWYCYERPGNGYVVSRFGIMHRMIMNAKNGQIIDHINCNKLDNRKCNLRFCTEHQNRMHYGLTGRNKTGYKGVKKRNDCNRWRAEIQFNYKIYNLGNFKDKKSAAIAYNEAAKKLYGEYAWLNKI